MRPTTSGATTSRSRPARYGSSTQAGGEPWYVVGKDVAQNTLIVAQGGSNRYLASHQLEASGATWVAGMAPAEAFACTAKTRYRQDDQACTVRVSGDRLFVQFDQAQRAVTPGQSVVFYDGDACLGGAVIEATDAAYGGLPTSMQAKVSA